MVLAAAMVDIGTLPSSRLDWAIDIDQRPTAPEFGKIKRLFRESSG